MKVTLTFKVHVEPSSVAIFLKFRSAAGALTDNV